MSTTTLPAGLTEGCAVACELLLRVRRQHAQGCHAYVNPHGKSWCPTCRRRVQVEDVSTEGGDMRPDGEHEWTVTYLECGHTTEVDRGQVAAAPGAPWAPGAHATVRDGQRARTHALTAAVDPRA